MGKLFVLAFEQSGPSMSQSWEFLDRLGLSVEALGPLRIFIAISISVLASLCFRTIYNRNYQSVAVGSNIGSCFPLVALSTTSIFICVQYSLPLSLGLLGALSIVRFRTPVKDPEEIGYLMVVIATSLGAATFQPVLVGSILTLGVGTALLFNGVRSTRNVGLSLVTFTVDRTKANEMLSMLEELALEHSVFCLLSDFSEQGDGATLTWQFKFGSIKQFSLYRLKLGELVQLDQFNAHLEGMTGCS